MADAPLTAPSLQFVRALAGSEEPALSLEPLGHHRSPDGPSGLVIGIANPLETYAPSTSLIDRPRQRRAPLADAEAESVGLVGAEAAGPEPVASAGDDVAPAPVIRALPAVAATPASSLTDAGSIDLGPPRHVQRSVEPAGAAQVAASSAVRMQSAPSTTADRAHPETPRTTDQPPLNLGLSRRRGLGAPLSSAATAAIQRSTQPSESGLAPGPRAVDEPDAMPLLSIQVSRSEPEFRAEIAVPQTSSLDVVSSLPLVKRQVAASEPGPASGAPFSPESPPRLFGDGQVGAAEQPTAAFSLPPTIQRIADLDFPLLPSVRRGSSGPETVPLTSTRQLLATGRRVQGATAGPQPAAAVQLLPVQRTVRESATGPAAQTWPAVPLSLSVGAPWAASPEAARRSPLAEAGPLVWGVQRQSTPPSPGDQPAGSEGLRSVEVQRFESAPPQPAVASTPIEMAWSAPSVQATFDGEAEVQRATAVGESAGGGSLPAHDSEKDLEELARKLHDRISSRIRFDLLVERERAGLVTDLR